MPNKIIIVTAVFTSIVLLVFLAIFGSSVYAFRNSSQIHDQIELLFGLPENYGNIEIWDNVDGKLPRFAILIMGISGLLVLMCVGFLVYLWKVKDQLSYGGENEASTESRT